MSLLNLYHPINIFIHIAFGSLAIALGLLILARPKGDKAHKSLGKITATIAAISITAALIGAFVFHSKADLMGVSVLVAYHIWSGIRSLRLKKNGRGLSDIVPAICLFLSGCLIIYLSKKGGYFHWEPARVYATAGGLIFFGAWDSLRIFFPQNWRKALNPAEHAFKMTCIIGSLVSVALATLIPAYAPLLVLSASVFFTGLALLFAFRAANKALRN